eukprot:12421326-Karenia_brevis.AAC.1
MAELDDFVDAVAPALKSGLSGQRWTGRDGCESITPTRKGKGALAVFWYSPLSEDYDACCNTLGRNHASALSATKNF